MMVERESKIEGWRMSERHLSRETYVDRYTVCLKMFARKT